MVQDIMKQEMHFVMKVIVRKDTIIRMEYASFVPIVHIVHMDVNILKNQKMMKKLNVKNALIMNLN